MNLNYIKRLEYENARKAAEIVGLRSILHDIKVYLSSTKFHEENWVNVHDILYMIQQGEGLVTRLVDETPIPR